MSRINYAAKHEYESMANYKILQTVFQRNRIDKPIPVDRLVRCKMQDNLEFLQWLKKFWDTNYAGDGYDADARRAAAPSRAGSAASMAGRRQSMGARAGTASRQSTVSRQGTVPPVPRHSTAPRPSVAPRPSAAPRPSVAGGASTPRTAAAANPAARRMSMARGGAPGRGASSAAISNETINQLTAEIDEMKVSVDSLERERDFYFGKLRDVEVLVQERLADLARTAEASDSDEKAVAAETETLKQIQGVLYQTEEGFELPDVVDQVRMHATTPCSHTQAEPLDETETF